MTASAIGDVVAGLGRMKPAVYLLRSFASDTQDETSTVALLAAFEAASFLGVAIGFLTERQLQAGDLISQHSVLIVPNATHVEDATVRALQKLPVGSVLLASNATHEFLRYSRECTSSMWGCALRAV